MSTPTSDYHKPSVAPSGMDHDALPPGTRFGEFEILKVVGVGGFGIVYLAHDHSLEREVALKEYMPASLAARGAGPQITVRSSSFAETYAIGLRSFVNEARLLARFDHPSLVKVYRFWEDNATAYMVMPFLQGTTLRDTRRAMPHPPDEAWIRSVIAPILSALELLHREGVYHRDIAPDNILLPPDGPPVLLDFGAARRVISDRTQSLTAILKPSYAPIEQYAEMTQLRQGPWTDLYALGAVIHYLLFGVPPAPATARAVQDDVEAIENRVVPGVSPLFLEAVAWMLSIRPNQRPQSAEQLRAVLDGGAEIPPRGRPGITIPGMAAPAGFDLGAPPEHRTGGPTAGPSSVDTSNVPTYLPTAHVGPPGAARTANFNPATQMPTARQPAPEPATTAPSMRRTASPGTVPPPFQPAPTTGGPASRRPDAQASRPATLPPPTGIPRSAAAAGVPRAPAASAASPAASAAAPKSSKLGLAVAGGVALAVVLAVAGWQLMARRGDAGAEGAAAAASAASAAADVAVAPATPPIAASTSQPAATTGVTPVVPAETIASPQLAASTAATTAAARPAASGQAVPSFSDPFRVLPGMAPTAAADARAASAADRATTLAAAAAAASNARNRPGAKPVPRAEGEGGLATYNGTSGRQPDGAGSAPAPYGATAVDRARAAMAARDQAAAQRNTPPSGTPVPATTTAAVEAAPASAREACGKRVFISLAICMDEKCEEARYRSTPECVGILARKTARENR